jgi:hypothetical protein
MTFGSSNIRFQLGLAQKHISKIVEEIVSDISKKL